MRKNRWIIVLVLVGLVALTMVEGIINPRIEAKQQAYTAEQQNPLTHDFAALQKYRSAYMGDFSNLSHLNQGLPLAEYLNGYQLYPDTFTAEVKYNLRSDELQEEELKRMLVYNATANFVLIDNLEHIVYQLEDTRYSLDREAAKQWAGLELGALQMPDDWDSYVREQLVSPEQVEVAFSQIIDN